MIAELFIDAAGVMRGTTDTGSALPPLDLTKPRPAISAAPGATTDEIILHLVSNGEVYVTALTEAGDILISDYGQEDGA